MLIDTKSQNKYFGNIWAKIYIFRNEIFSCTINYLNTLLNAIPDVLDLLHLAIRSHNRTAKLILCSKWNDLQYVLEMIYLSD